MNITMLVAATVAAITSATAVSAADPSGGHYEWQSRTDFGPNKSNIQSRVRVWVKDAKSDMASCHCAKMPAGAMPMENMPDMCKSRILAKG